MIKIPTGKRREFQWWQSIWLFREWVAGDMNESKRKSTFMLLLVAALLVLLPLLAVLQYRWLGEVSQAERERMQANLRTSAERLCSDFDRELTAAYVQLQSPSLPNTDQ